MRRVLLAFILLGALSYGSGACNPFVHDDVVFILNEPKVHSFLGIFDVFNQSSFAPSTVAVANAYYRPFLDIIYRLEYALFADHALGYHIVNIILHIANAWLLFVLTLRLSRQRVFSGIVAAFFLVHPVQSEAVACISGISNLLFVFFVFFSFLFYIIMADEQGPSSALRQASLYGGSLLFFFAALLCKEQAIILPLLLALYEFCFCKGVGRDRIYKCWRLGLSGFGIIAGGYLMWHAIVAKTSLNSFVNNWGEFYLRLKSFPGILISYLQSIFWPFNLHYYRSYDILSEWIWPLVVFSLCVGICILIWLALPNSRKRLYAFGLGWFVIALLPTSIVPLVHEYSWIAAFEHFLYWPLAGLLWSVVIALDYFLDRIFRRDSANVKTAAIIIAISSGILLTQAQTRFWRGEIPLFKRALAYENKMGRLHLLLAQAYYNAGDFGQAQREYEIAGDIMSGYLGKIRDQRVKPFYLGFLKDSLRGIAGCQQAFGNWQAAAKEYEKILLFSLPDSSVENNLGVCAIHSQELEKAQRHFRRALEIDPNFVLAKMNLEQLLQQIQDKK